MYLFIGNKDEFMNGRTNRSVAQELEVNEGYISLVLHQRRKCSKVFAYAFTKAVGKSNVKNYFLKK